MDGLLQQIAQTSFLILLICTFLASVGIAFIDKRIVKVLAWGAGLSGAALAITMLISIWR